MQLLAVYYVGIIKCCLYPEVMINHTGKGFLYGPTELEVAVPHRSLCTLQIHSDPLTVLRAQLKKLFIVCKKDTIWVDGHIFTRKDVSQFQLGGFLGVYVHLICHLMTNYE